MALTGEQLLHNRLLDLEIELAEREFQLREENARLAGEAWKKANPNSTLMSMPFMNMIGRKKVIGIRYVE